MKKLLLPLAVLFFAGSAFADVYKWVDKDGKVHYGDEKSADTNTAEKVDETPANTFSSKEAMTDEMRKQLEDSEKDRAAKEADEKAAAKEAKDKADKAKADAEAAEKARLAERKRLHGY